MFPPDKRQKEEDRWGYLNQKIIYVDSRVDDLEFKSGSRIGFYKKAIITLIIIVIILIILALILLSNFHTHNYYDSLFG